MKKKKYTDGDCYVANGKIFLYKEAPLDIKEIDNENIVIVHGSPTLSGGPYEGKKFGHCWIENDETVYDFSNGKHAILPKILYYTIGKINEKDNHSYTHKQYREKILETSTWGPWHKVPEEEWLKIHENYSDDTEGLFSFISIKNASLTKDEIEDVKDLTIEGFRLFEYEEFNIQKILDNAKYVKRNKNSKIVRLNIDVVIEKSEPSYRVERGNKNEMPGRIDRAKKFLEKNPEVLEPSSIYFRDDGFIGFQDGRHRIIAAKELGAEYAFFEIENRKEQMQRYESFKTKMNESKLNETEYIYHGTGKGQALNIQRDGYMKPNKTGEQQPSISFTNDLDYAKYYAKSKGGISKMCILRTKLTDDYQLSPRIKNNKGDEYITFKKVPSSELEVMTTSGWQPLDIWNVIFDELL